MEIVVMSILLNGHIHLSIGLINRMKYDVLDGIIQQQKILI